MTRAASLLLLAAFVAGCSDDGTSGTDDAGTGGAVIVTTTTIAGANGEAPTTTGTTPDAPTTSSEAAGTTGPINPPSTAEPSTTEPATTAPTTAPAAVGDPVVASEVITTVDQPVDLAVRSPQDDQAAYIVGQSGIITRLDFLNQTETTALDLTGRVSSANEQGLLGLTFSPAGSHAYVNFTDTDGTTTIAEYTVVDSDSDATIDGTLDPATERIVLTVDQPYRNHNAGDLEFGPDGMLYIPLGDGGSGGDPERRASDPTSLLGSLLRIDPTPSGDAPYTIPPDNPFADGPFDGIEGAPEVWAWGLRNPWKIAFDPVNGDLWIADVGQNQFEEINRVPATDRTAGFATDFGWSAFEGTERFNDDVPATDAMVPPVLVYSHASGGCSISGGVPYRGELIPELEPAYVYSDYCNSTIWALDLAGGRTLTLLEGFGEVTAVRSGPTGELYVLERSGAVHQLVPG